MSPGAVALLQSYHDHDPARPLCDIVIPRGLGRSFGPLLNALDRQVGRVNSIGIISDIISDWFVFKRVLHMNDCWLCYPQQEVVVAIAYNRSSQNAIKITNR